MVGPIAARTPPKAAPGRAVPAVSRSSVATAVAAGDPGVASAFDVARLKGALDAARVEAHVLTLPFRKGPETGASAFAAARIELARAKLGALKLAAAVHAVRGDAKGALGVAEEAVKVAGDVVGLRGDLAAAEVGAAIDTLAQAARRVVAIARRGAPPDGAEGAAMAALQKATGVPDPGIDTVSDGDLALAATAVREQA